jgi:hypothetical protein
MQVRRLQISPAERQALIALRDHDRRPYLRERAAALLKIADGAAPYAVARRGLLKPRKPDTVYRWLTAFEADGITGLVHKPRGHRGRFP